MYIFLLYIWVWPENKGIKSNPILAAEVIDNIPDDLEAFGSEQMTGPLTLGSAN